MITELFRRLLKRKRRSAEISPDEIFLDSQNLPEFDRHQFEGRIEKPISARVVLFAGILFTLVLCVYIGRLYTLELVRGEEYAKRSENNRLDQVLVFSDRGIVLDRNGIQLAWNIPNDETTDFSLRKYSQLPGISGLVGFLKYPTKDSAGFYFREDFEGVAGVEKFYNNHLQGENGLKLIETDARGQVHSEGVVRPPKTGKNLTLSIDARIQSKLYELIHELAERVSFQGGAGVIMDVHTGEIIAHVNYPEYDSQVLTDGADQQKVREFLNHPSNPFLNRVSQGLYTPGSIMKTFFAIGALAEKVISPATEILSTGALTLPNPYNPDRPTIFRDWRAHGWTDMRRAIAVSSDVYFYTVGGGFQSQKGIGITNIEKYSRLFGFGEDIKSPFFSGKKGVIPTPAWKKENFDGEEWTIGNTYHTSIGQYGYQVTPIQVARAYAALATRGVMPEPTIVQGEETQKTTINLDNAYFQVVHEGMRLAVKEGTAAGLNVSHVEIAAKTGTAELGATKSFVNSWTAGFFPYKNPRYAFVVLMERGPVTNLTGATYVMRQLVDWMYYETPEYFE